MIGYLRYYKVMIRIALVEDEENNVKEINSYLKRYSKEYNVEIQISNFGYANLFLSQYNNNFDIVLMDIGLPDIDGMTAIRKLREIDNNVLVIFVTNLAQYAVNGYEVDAFDFLVKPVSYYNLVLKINRALERIGSRKEKQIWVSTRNEKRLIMASKLKYVEVIKHKIIYHTVDGEVSSLGSLKNVCDELEGLSFALCNQCYLVNLHYVTGIDGYKCIIGNEVLQISLPKKNSFIHALNNYLGGGLGK